MSFVAKPSESTVPFALIKSLLPSDPINNKIVYLQRNSKNELKTLFDEAKSKEDEEFGEYEHAFPSASAPLQRRPSRDLSSYDKMQQVRAQRMYAWARESDDPMLLREVEQHYGYQAKPNGKVLTEEQLLKRVEKLQEVKTQKETSLKQHQLFEPLCNPEPSQRDIILCVGPSGSGKSSWVNEYALSFNRCFPSAPVFIFSVVPEDKAFTMKNQQRIQVDEQFVADPIAVNELANSLVIFDDIDHIPEEGGLRAACYKLRDQILEIGRHQRIYMCITSHELFGGKKKTSVMKREATCIVMFPAAGMNAQYTQYLKAEHMLTPKQIKDMLSIKSHWVALYGHAPKAVLSERKAYILS